jgi:hypothetical protein
VAASVVNFAYVAYVISVYLFTSHVAKGWTTLSMQLAVMFMFMFAILTVLAEYVGHILSEAKERPLYHVIDERSSTVLLADTDRRNVMSVPGTLAAEAVPVAGSTR